LFAGDSYPFFKICLKFNERNKQMLNGFVDLQVNGWMGTDFMNPDLTLDKILEITKELASRGTAAYCPTFVTGDPEIYKRNLSIFARAAEDQYLSSHILGLHIEGPFISSEPGAIGAHPRKFVRNPDIRLFDRMMEWSGGTVKILTLAPELPGAEKLIRHAVERGVVVSIGHHMANDEELMVAVEAGATLATHVGNGIPNMIHRHANPLWWLLACDSLSGLFITDGHHLPDDFIKVALRAKTLDHFVVTSDASTLAGMPPGKYTIFGSLEVTIDSTGLIYSEQSKGLAGSHSTMIECMNHLASMAMLTEKELWQVGRDNPLEIMKRDMESMPSSESAQVEFKNGRFAATNSEK
jgi:N-acetylglucosamine-6-phosphate deacetylase